METEAAVEAANSSNARVDESIAAVETEPHGPHVGVQDNGHAPAPPPPGLGHDDARIAELAAELEVLDEEVAVLTRLLAQEDSGSADSSAVRAAVASAADQAAVEQRIRDAVRLNVQTALASPDDAAFWQLLQQRDGTVFRTARTANEVRRLEGELAQVRSQMAPRLAEVRELGRVLRQRYQQTRHSEADREQAQSEQRRLEFSTQRLLIAKQILQALILESGLDWASRPDLSRLMEACCE